LEAIRVNTYVNLEMEADFVTELAKQIVEPVNNITADFTNILDIDIIIPEFDVIPDIDVSIERN
jgi:hypothetical protein